MPDREVFERLRERRRKERAAARRDELTHMRQGGIAVAKLTGDPSWDGFMRILAAREDDAASAYENAKEKLVGSPDPLALRLEAAVLLARRDTLREVIALPESLREQGSKASELLEELDEASG